MTTNLNQWLWAYESWDPELEGLREALCTLGNGYFATRGAAAEATADGIHYPGTYLAGVYNRLRDEVSGRVVENESFVNAPNWLPISFRAEDGPWLGDPGTEILAHHQELDMYRGVLVRRTRFRDTDDRILQLTQRRFVSMRDPHLAGLETTVVAENWEGRVELRSALDGTVRNEGVARYRALGTEHLTPVDAGADGELIWLEVVTNQSHVQIAEAARTRLFRNGRQVEFERDQSQREGYVEQRGAVNVRRGEELLVEKVIALFTSRDLAISEPALEARDWASNVAGSFEALLERHALTWSHLWRRVRIELGADAESAQLINLHTFHVLQTVSNNSVGLDVGIPARGIHGEAYRGHVFWDELFVFPFLSLRLPELARSLLRYRYRRLDEARRAATVAGYGGAMFPWQSGSDGREETQRMHLNPLSGRWRSDPSYLQRHVNAAIVASIWQYYQATGDREFLRFYGAEMILEIARFWSHIATYNHLLDRYEIKGVIGPDEYHEGYPDRDVPGLDNNAYTNLMAVWCLCRGFDVLETLPPVVAGEMSERLGLTRSELDRWDQVSRKMRVCFHDGVISQFEGYERLAELDWDRYRGHYGDVARLDRILEAEGDSPNRYKFSKQADVIMLFYVLSAEELAELLGRLGYEYDADLIHRNFEYYIRRTSHGSTLSRVVHAWVAARRDRRASWELFVQALQSDAANVRGGTTAEGIHLGAMAGTLDLVQRCYTGLEMRPDTLRFNPAIPGELGSVAFDVRYRGRLIHLEFTTEVARAQLDLTEGAPITVEIKDTRRTLAPGETMEVKIG
jgi:trehalose/maltose hydrolase-like predicted phosphorylase